MKNTAPIFYDLAEAEASMLANMEAGEAQAMSAAMDDNERELMRLQIGLRDIPLRSLLWQLDCFNRDIADESIAAIFGSVVGNTVKSMLANAEDQEAFFLAVVGGMSLAMNTEGTLRGEAELAPIFGGNA